MTHVAGTGEKQILVFSLDEFRYALNLSVVERVVRAVEITPLPKAPEMVLGVINVQGDVILVVNLRTRLHLAARELNLDDQFILARTARRRVALVADFVVGCRELADPELAPAEAILPGAEYIHGVAKLDDSLVLICDLEQFLALHEEQIPSAESSRDTP